jgi:peroxiredoxin
MTGLANGSVFPALDLPAVGGGTMRLPDDLAGSWAVVIIYRGHWCPYCKAQLTAYQRALPNLTEAGIRVAALSVDDEEHATEMARRHGLEFPIGYDADAQRVAATLQSYQHNDPAYLESSGFVLDPDTRIVVAAYSSNAIGRLLPDDVLGLVRYAQNAA